MVKVLTRSMVVGLLAGFVLLSPAWAAEKVPVFVSILPQKFFVEQIGKDLLDVQVMVEPGASPHTYEPKPRQMAAISKARIYFAIGVTFEKVWLDRIAASNPGMLVVHTDHGIEKLPMAAHHDHGDEKHDHKAHQHHGEDKDYKEAHDDPQHDHGERDPHIWLSPPLVIVQARHILTALQRVDPVNHAAYEANYQAFTTKAAKLDAELRSLFAGKKGLRFMVFHPAWAYFADAYGLVQVSIELEGKEPKPAQLKQLIDHARERDIKVVFVQPQFSVKSAEVVAQGIGGQVAFADPLAQDWIENLRGVAAKFEAAVR